MLKLVLGTALFALAGCVAYVPIDSSVPYSAPYVAAGPTCYAGFYVCPAPPGPPGAPCSCPGLAHRRME